STPSAAAASLTSHEEAQARYTALKAQIQETLRKKRNIDRTLSDLESQIWLFEGSYFTSTAASGGNIVKGFENYLKGGPAGASSGASADAVANEDRVFSASSLTYQRSLELK
ncbi:NuA4-domain-containing protein, partial [Microstroma glucosiphilum]